MDGHLAALASVCRIGGQKFELCAISTKYGARKYSEAMKQLFNINVDEDDPEIHPPFVCHKCMHALQRCTEGGSYSGGGCAPLMIWSPHHDKTCLVCNMELRVNGVDL